MQKNKKPVHIKGPLELNEISIYLQKVNINSGHSIYFTFNTELHKNWECTLNSWNVYNMIAKPFDVPDRRTANYLHKHFYNIWPLGVSVKSIYQTNYTFWHVQHPQKNCMRPKKDLFGSLTETIAL